MVKSYNNHILVLQEIRWLNKGTIKKEKMALFYSGSESEKHENGIRILIHVSILLHINTFEAIKKDYVTLF